jgi:lipoprotein NlpI
MELRQIENFLFNIYPIDALEFEAEVSATNMVTDFSWEKTIIQRYRSLHFYYREEDHLITNDSTLWEAYHLVRSCRSLLQDILENHRTRM